MAVIDEQYVTIPKATLEAARRFKAELLASRGGQPFSDSTEIIREMREERTRQLS